MESRKSRNVYISKYFMAVRNCINIFVLCYYTAAAAVENRTHESALQIIVKLGGYPLED